MKAVFDTNLLVNYLNGLAAANHEIERYEEIASRKLGQILVTRNPKEFSEKNAGIGVPYRV